VTHFTEAELKEQDEAYLASLPKPKPAPIPPKATEKAEKLPLAPKLTSEQERTATSWTKALEMVRKGRLTSLQQYWERECQTLGGINAIPPVWAEEKPMTLLQAASAAGQEEVVQWLLEDAKADPSIPVPGVGVRDADVRMDSDESRSSQTAYDLSSTREVRNVFRRCAGAHPDWWDWFGKGHVPATLTQEMEEKKDEKKRQRRGVLKDKIRERMAQEKTEVLPEHSPPAPVVRFEEPTSGPQKLGGRSGAQGDVNGLTAEMRMKIERERRARAAEARLTSLGS